MSTDPHDSTDDREDVDPEHGAARPAQGDESAPATERVDESPADESPVEQGPLGPYDTGSLPVITETASPESAPATSSSPAESSTESRTRRTRLADRPIPRSGLSEHRAAGILTGDLSPERSPLTERLRTTDDEDAAPEETATTVVPAPVSARDDAGDRAAQPRATESNEPDTGVLLDGATIAPEPPSRAAAHWWGVLIALVGVPVAWYLLADAGARLTLPPGNPWETGSLNVAALIEFASGLVVLSVVVLMARWSSVGSFVIGGLTVVVGVPFLAVPDLTRDWLQPVFTRLRDFNDFGGNLAHHLEITGSTGLLVVLGLALILVGFVSHGARRQGRREARAHDAFARSRR